MSQLPFYSDDGIKTLAELLALRSEFRTDSLVMAIESRILQKPTEISIKAEHVVVVIEDLEREVNNGGFSSYIESSVVYLPFIQNYLELIECFQMAGIVATAISRTKGIDLAVEAAQAELSKIDFEDLDQQFFAYPESIEELLLTYIDKNRLDFQIDPAPAPDTVKKRWWVKGSK